MTVTTSVLIGRIIQGLETSLMGIKSSSSTFSSDSCSSFLAPKTFPSPYAEAPKLSLGELQIEPDEENQLQQYLWQLQFRKLREVIAKMSISVRQLTASHGGNAGAGAGAGGGGGGNSANVMACQCIHMWLVQKTDGLKARFDTQEGEKGIAE